MDNSALSTGFGIGGIIGGIIGIAFFVFWIVELVDVIRRDFGPGNGKLIWVLVVVLLNWVGAAIYYFVGKPQGTLRA